MFYAGLEVTDNPGGAACEFERRATGKESLPAGDRSGLVRLATATGFSLAAEGWLEVVLGVWAFRAGGAGLVAVVAAILFLPAAVSTPVIILQ